MNTNQIVEATSIQSTPVSQLSTPALYEESQALEDKVTDLGEQVRELEQEIFENESDGIDASEWREKLHAQLAENQRVLDRLWAVENELNERY